MSAIAMPGFIDILSTVIIMFVFFVTVIAVMLYVHMIKYKSTLEQETKVKVAQEVQATVTQLQSQSMSMSPSEQVTQLQQEKAQLQEKIKTMEAELKQVQPDFANSNVAQRTSESTQEKSLTIFFDGNAITVHPETVEAVKAFLAKYTTQPANVKVQITAPLNPAAPTSQSAKQMGLARMLNGRNILIQSQVQQSNVLVTFVGVAAVDNNYNWIKIKVE